MTLTFLGTGTSVGVPQIGCTCEVCRSVDPRDNRLRCSALVEVDGKHILIDCGPDFRTQALQHQITEIDAVLITHEHYDHVGGLDDVRPFGDVNIYAEERVLGAIRRVMPYSFGPNKYPGSPTISLHALEVQQPFHLVAKGAEQEEGNSQPTILADLPIIPLRVEHGNIPILGYRIGRMAYITDASALPEQTKEALRGVEILVINALRIEKHPSHFSLEESIEVAQQIGAKKVYFTHFSHDIGRYSQVEPSLPAGFHMAYDGLTIDC